MFGRVSWLKLLFFLVPVLFPSHVSGQPLLSGKIKIQKLDDFVLDGNFQEWEKVPERILYADSYGNTTKNTDLTASFKLAWKSNKILVYIQIEDNNYRSDTANPWNGDGVELFLSGYQGSEDILHYAIMTGTIDQGQANVKIFDRRRNKCNHCSDISLQNRTVRQGNRLRMELELNYDVFASQDKNGLCFQLYVDDTDEENSHERKRLAWHPLSHSYMSSFSAYELELSGSENTLMHGTSRVIIRDNTETGIIVFGARSGDVISIQSNDGEFSFLSASESPHEADVYSLPALNTEKDSLRIFINGHLNSMHDLFISEREFRKVREPRFDREIRWFLKMDRICMPPPNATLFIGSSSIRLWNDLQKDFPGNRIIHRGFGGSTSGDVVKYMDDIVIPYNPSRIVYYEGDNDIPLGIPFQEIINNMKQFIERAVENNPSVSIFLISPKPSLAREHLWPEYRELHKRMIQLSGHYDSVYFVDVASEMFSPEGNLKNEIFAEDGLHMNDRGYDIWRKILNEQMNLTRSE